MDDSCAVCAESLSWVAYGPCGHREVCSTCVVRLRFVLEDRRCCICKVESPVVFVTKVSTCAELMSYLTFLLKLGRAGAELCFLCVDWRIRLNLGFFLFLGISKVLVDLWT